MRLRFKEAGVEGWRATRCFRPADSGGAEELQHGPGYFSQYLVRHFGSNVGASWSGMGGAPTVYHYNEYVSETTLQDLGKTRNRLDRHDQNDRSWKMSEPRSNRTSKR